MKFLGLKKIDEFKEKHADARGALDSWRYMVKSADWSSPQDVKNDYATASFLEDNLIIFNIKGKKYRLVIKVKYKCRTVQIEWIGTHAEYSKKTFI